LQSAIFEKCLAVLFSLRVSGLELLGLIVGSRILERIDIIRMANHSLSYIPYRNPPRGHSSFHPEMGMPVNIHVNIRRKNATGTLPPGAASIGAMACKGAITFLPIMSELIMSGIFDRIPALQINGIEVDAGWIPWAFEAIDNYYWRNRTHTGVTIKEMPSYYWRHNFAVAFMQDFTAIRNRRAIGVENMLWSSDYPHHGNDWPYSRKVISEMMQDCSSYERYMMCAGNVVRIYGLDQTYVPPALRKNLAPNSI